MGRAKLSMELISKEKARCTTYQKRKKGLKKKAYELKTLCGVEVGMIVYGPKINEHPTEEEIWPPKHDEIQPLIDSYKKQSTEDRKRRSNDLSNFFKDRNKKVEDALVKLRRKNDEAKFPTWDDRYNDCSEEELREFGATLESKLQDVRARIEFIKGINRSAEPGIMGSSHMQLTPNHPYFMQGLFSRSSMQLEVIHEQQARQVNSADVVNMPIHHHHRHPFQQQTHHQGLQLDANPMANSMLMMLMNDNHYAQAGGASGSNFVYNPELDRPIYYDPVMSGMLENMVANNPPRPTIGYYSSSMQPIAPYIQYPMMAGASSQVNASQMEDYYGLSGFHMKNPK